MKKALLFVSLLGVISALILRYSVDLGICSGQDYRCVTSTDTMEWIAYFFIPVFVFSSFSYFMPESVFSAWWKFARISVPAIFLLIILISQGILHSDPSGSLGGGAIFNQIFDFYASLALYLVFVLGSVIQIIRGYFRK